MHRRLALVLALCAACGASRAPASSPGPTVELTTPDVTVPPTTAALIWTSPPTTAPTPTAAPTPTGVLVTPEVPAPPPTRTPALPVASATRPGPVPTATRTADPFRWTGYIVDGGPTIYVPSTWPAVDPAALRGLAIFAASPETPHPTVLSYRTIVTLQRFSIARSDITAETFADSFQRTILSSVQTVRERADLPAGSAVLLKYQETKNAGTDQQVNAFLMRNGSLYMIGLRTPLDRVAQTAPIFNEVLRRFSP